jgi:hypothetical protein
VAEPALIGGLMETALRILIVILLVTLVAAVIFALITGVKL